jgi:ribosomal protein L11 methylase PrmA
LGILQSLESIIKKLSWQPRGTEWGDYYDATNYTDAAQQHKGELVGRFMDAASPKSVWDLGANTGVFSRIASQKEIPTVAFDIDPAAVEKNYRACKANKDKHLLPLVQDLTNPSPGIGWHHDERMSLLGRGPADTVLALALIHHLAISNNLPLARVAKFFAEAGRSLIIEFVPKTDSQVKRLLASRKDIFPSYTQEGFEQAFSQYFTIRQSEAVQDSERVLYLMDALDRS